MRMSATSASPCLIGLSILIALLPGGTAGAQEPEDSVASSEGLRVYLDCQRCDFDYIREEVPSVDYVRDQGAADVHVLVTREFTGSGGQEYTFHFMGREELAGRADTLRYTSQQTDTDDEVRQGYVRTFGLGLVRYLAYASEGNRVDLSFTRPEPTAGATTTAEEDPWNLWVFRTSMSGEIEGESLQRSRALDGSLSASRTTEEFKIDVNFRGEYEWEEFDFEQDDGSIESRTSSATEIDASTTAVWSVGPHWSWGLSADAGSDSPSNQSFYMSGGPALEYSLYPYAEATSRQITALYRVGAATFQYQDTTVFGQLAETRPEHSLQVSANFRQPWGEWVLSLEGSHYLDDISQHRVDAFTNLEIRLFQGFNLDIRGSVARIKDQIYLSVREIDVEDRITGRAEIGTDFEYSVDVGFSFTFGSVFNNVVNPRIRTGGGRRFF